MPSASDELRARMEQRFGDPVSDSGPINFLKNAGYTLTNAWTWYKPDVTTLDKMTDDEYECLLFLVHEWDFGGLAREEIEQKQHQAAA